MLMDTSPSFVLMGLKLPVMLMCDVMCASLPVVLMVTSQTVTICANLPVMLMGSSRSQFFFPGLSPNNGGGQIYPIVLEIVLTPNLHLERLLASFLLSPPFLHCSITALSQIFFGLPIFIVPLYFKI